jgi:hypothetical protein
MASWQTEVCRRQHDRMSFVPSSVAARAYKSTFRLSKLLGEKTPGAVSESITGVCVRVCVWVGGCVGVCVCECVCMCVCGEEGKGLANPACTRPDNKRRKSGARENEVEVK